MVGSGLVGSGRVGFLQKIIPLRGSILQAGTCQILSLAENPRWSPSVAKMGDRIREVKKLGDITEQNAKNWIRASVNKTAIDSCKMD